MFKTEGYELKPGGDHKPLSRYQCHPTRMSFYGDEELFRNFKKISFTGVDKPPLVPYKNRHNSRLIKPIRPLIEPIRKPTKIKYVLIFVDKKPYLVGINSIENNLKFTGWVGETPPDAPILEFFLDNNGVLKARINYGKWWRISRVTTVFQLVEEDICGDPTIPTLAQEPCKVSYFLNEVSYILQYD